MTDKTTAERWYMLNKDGMAMLCADKADAEQEAIDAQAAWPGMGPHRAVQLVEAGASLPLPGAQEAVATVFTMEALTPGAGVKYHATIHKLLPAGTKLYAAPQPALSAGWQPIETAPKDGRTLLLGYFNSANKWRTTRGQWVGQDYIDEYAEEPERMEPGWHETTVEDDDGECWPIDPTHWQPLPTSPSMDGESNG